MGSKQRTSKVLWGLLVPKWREGRGLGKDPEKELSEKHKETGRESAENVTTGGFLSSYWGKNSNCLHLSPCGPTCWCIKILLLLHPGSLLLEISKAEWAME